MAAEEPRGSWLAILLVGGAVCIALGLALLELCTPPVQPREELKALALTAFEQDVVLAHQRVAECLADMQRLSAEQQALALSLVNPGPEPDWYHPIDRWQWDNRKAAFDAGLAAITAARDHVLAAERQLNAARHHLQEREKLADLARLATQRAHPEDIPGPVREAARWLWNAIIRPLLHWLLVIALLLFALNRLMRLALIQGWLGEERL